MLGGLGFYCVRAGINALAPILFQPLPIAQTPPAPRGADFDLNMGKYGHFEISRC